MTCGGDLEVGPQRLVGRLLELLHLRRADLVVPAEVEAQVAGLVVRAGLQSRSGRGSRAAPRARCGCRCAPGRRRAATARRPLASSSAPRLELALEHPHLVHDQAGHRALHVDDLAASALPDQRRRCRRPARPTRRRTACGRAPPRPGRRLRRPPRAAPSVAAAARCTPAGLVSVSNASDSVRPVPVDGLAVGAGVGVLALLGPRVGLGPLALLGHQRGGSPSSSTSRPCSDGHLQGQVDREAVGVVQLERLGARQPPLAARPGLLDRGVEDLRARHAGSGGRPPPRRRRSRRSGRSRPPSCGYDARQPGDGDRQQRRQRRLVDAEQPHRVAPRGAAAGAARSRGPRCRARRRRRSASGRCGRGRRPPASARRRRARRRSGGRTAPRRRRSPGGSRRSRTCCRRPAAGRRPARDPCRCRCSCSAARRGSGSPP